MEIGVLKALARVLPGGKPAKGKAAETAQPEREAMIPATDMLAMFGISGPPPKE